MIKNKRNKSILLSIMLLVSIFVMSSCQTFDAFVHTFIEKGTDDNDNTICIGVLESQTGKNSESGNNQVKGIRLAHKIYNNVNGKDIELIVVDDKSNTKTAKNAIEELIEMKPVAIIGSAGNATSLIASDYIEKVSIPAITPSATNPLIVQKNGYYFMTDSTRAQQGKGLAEYSYQELKSERIGIVEVKNESVSNTSTNNFVNEMERLEGKKKSEKIVVTTEISITDDKLQGNVRELRKADVDTVYLPLSTVQADMFFNEIERYGMEDDITFLGTADWGQEDFVKMLKKHPKIKVAFPHDGLNVDIAKEGSLVTDEARRFQIEYDRMYGVNDDPTQDAALGYDAYLLVVNAISRSKSLEGKDVREALFALSGIHCATGIYEFDDNGTTIKSVNIATINDGEIVPIYTTHSAKKAEVIEEIQQ